jgi:exo-beta-1,3-glucanase (GH17 family)
MFGRMNKATWLFCVFNAAFLSLFALWFYQKNQPQHIVKPILSDNKVQCVSYAPYHYSDQSPFITGMWVNKKQIDEDLLALSKISQCVRTYSVGQGMDYVPEAAAKIGMQVYLGAWIGWTDLDNLKELNLAIKQANAYPNTVKALIVGNEVLLRKEQSELAMQRYLKIAKRQTQTPVTYADVWEYWIKHKNLAQYVDFVTVHILPYWEDNPVAIENAVPHATAVMQKLKSIFTKPIMIGETGWPSVGRQREASAPSLINEATYMRAFLQKANDEHWQYNLIEAIDQPWKRVLEGTVGGYWGIFDTDLSPKFSFDGPVAERHDGYRPIVAGLLGALLFFVIVLKHSEQRIWVNAGLIVLGAITGLAGYVQWGYLAVACRDWSEWLMLGGLVVLGWVSAVIQPFIISRSSKWIQNIHSVILWIFVLAAIVTSLFLLMDGRYRDFPIAVYMLPALISTYCFWSDTAKSALHAKLYLWFTTLGFFLAILCVIPEPNNRFAVYWLCINTIFLVTAFYSQYFSSKVAKIK